MCLGIPGRITGINDDGLLRQGTVDFGGTTRDVCLAYVPEAVIDDWVLVHVGFAISQLSEDDARRTLDDLQQLAAARPEPNPPGPEDGP